LALARWSSAWRWTLLFSLMKKSKTAMARLAVVLGFVFFLAATHAHAAVQRLGQAKADRITPALEHQSSKKFDQDFPLDKRAAVDEHYKFGHPYPTVQDSSDFDSDFVKDENSDGGVWDAQMKYDLLRAKIQKAKAKLAKLKTKMETEYDEWMHAKKDASDVDAALESARKDAELARNAAEAAAKRVNDLEGHSQNGGTGVGGAIGEAIGDVKKEMQDLQNCKEALAKAREALKKVLKAKDDEKVLEEQKEKEEAAKKVEEDQKQDKAKEDAKNSKQDEEQKKKAHEKDEKNKDAQEKMDETAEKQKEEQEEEKLRKEIEKDTKDATSWRDTYIKELAEVRKTEIELEAAAKTLKKFRRSPYVDKDGGVYNVPGKSFATGHSPTGFLVVILSLLFAARARAPM